MTSIPASDALERLGWDLAWEQAWSEASARLGVGCVPGRVGRVDRSAFDVHTGGGVLRVGVGAVPVCTGDWVVVSRGEHSAVVEVLPRRAAFVRADASGRSEGHVLAANLDVCLIVVALGGEVDLGRIERLVALGWSSGAQPVVVLTKADLVDDVASAYEQVSLSAPGCEVLVVSATTGEGLDAVEALARPNRTLALLGVSGAGKSTLANALLGADLLEVGDVRAVDGKGRHTTTARELLPLPSGGVLVDTPGLRGVGLYDADDGIALAFSDVEDFAVDCRFGDCSHTSEPGCAVLAAVDAGELDARRVESWHKLQREAAWMARRSDAAAMAAERRRWKAVHQSVRSARDAGFIKPVNHR